MDNTDHVEAISVLVSGNNNFSAMVNTEDGESVLSGTYYEVVQVQVLHSNQQKMEPFLLEDVINGNTSS
ncbi:MAG: hypothetical protein MTP17_03775 [Candidatus Midichloria sp.]|nr:MAG: hypothetical protein MTP17_03775 [Candidatus Midichloria sp.]